MRYFFARTTLSVLGAICVMSLSATCVTYAQNQQQTEFVRAEGDRLLVGEREFRFMSFNIPNLHLVEDNFSFTKTNPWRWPNEFEIRDALESIRQMGGKATRIYVLSVRREGSDMGEHVYVRGPGDFNEQAFRVLDKVLQVANEKGIRVIIPLVDNWHWWGGAAEYAKFRNKPAQAFWSDDQIISDFELTIRFTLNRKNTYSGVAYKDDPAILGWETGNELDSTPAWTRRISAFIKSQDENHLVIDGYALHGVRQESLDDPNIDVITTHHYPNTDTDYVAAITKAHKTIAGKKPYFVGEFGFVSPPELRRVMDTIISKGISGGMLWSLRFHNRDGGFYWHSEPSGDNLYKAYHWPGFPTGEPYQETQILQLTREKAFEINGLAPPPLAPPKVPELLPIADVSQVSWRGSAGASRYDVQRATDPQGPWTTVGKDVSDAAVQYRPLFADETAEINRSYFYRVVAKNEAGSSAASNIVGPVNVPHQTLIDECQDASKLHSSSSEVEVLSLHARKTQEDVHRFRMTPETQLVYETTYPIDEWKIFLFCEGSKATLKTSSSVNGQDFTPCTIKSVPTDVGGGDYGYLQPLMLTGKSAQTGARYLKITTPPSQAEVQISRVEIVHGKASKRRNNATTHKQLGAQLNPSILMFHKPYHTRGVESVRRATELGLKKVNVVVTLHCDINKQNEVQSFGVRRGGKYRPLTDRLLADFKLAVRQVFAEVAANDMQLSVLAHLNAGGRHYEWRNYFLFDPLAYYQGFCYQDSLVAAIKEALIATPEIKTPVDIALAGEMGTSVFAYPASYAKIVDDLRANEQLPQVNLGISFNFNKAAGELDVSPRGRHEAQLLVNQCDFIGLSNYRWFDLPIDADDFTSATHLFLDEMRESGAAVPPGTPLHFSEVGIGGGTENGLAKNPAEATVTPWNGSADARKNPWNSAEMQQFRRDYHRALLDFLAHPSPTNPVTAAYLWSEGSWDPLDTTDRGFADKEIIKMIQQHNRQVAE